MRSRPIEILLAAAFGVCIGAGLLTYLRAGPAAPRAADPPSLPRANVSDQVTAPPPAVRAQNYEFRDGMDYGYTAAISAAQRQTGQAAPTVVMFAYAGQQDGRHQVHLREGNVLRAAECSAPCEMVRFLSVVDAEGLRSDVVVDHVRNAPNMIAGLALADAIAGRLERYAEHQGKRRYALWVDQHKGLVRTRLSDGTAKGS